MDILNRIFMSSACPIRSERERERGREREREEKTKKEFKELK